MMNFLRKIYKKIWWIDEWLYIYKNLNQKKIDRICAKNKTGYADLWMKNEIRLKSSMPFNLSFSAVVPPDLNKLNTSFSSSV